MSDLKPCPVPGCRSTDVFIQYINDPDGWIDLHYGKCGKCGVAGPQLQVDRASDPEGDVAVDAWNALPRDEWISVEEGMPGFARDVLIYTCYGDVCSASYDGECWILFDSASAERGPYYDLADVTHWRPLPAGPEDA